MAARLDEFALSSALLTKERTTLAVSLRDGNTRVIPHVVKTFFATKRLVKRAERPYSKTELRRRFHLARVPFESLLCAVGGVRTWLRPATAGGLRMNAVKVQSKGVKKASTTRAAHVARV